MDKIKGIFKDYYKIIVILILVFIMVNLSTKLTAFRQDKFPINLDRNQGVQILTQMIGEVRTILASYIYIRADMYHHERETKKDWREDPATLPLHRLVTMLDPKFVQAYDFGAYHLAVNFKKYHEAIKYLREGLHYNPESFTLHFTMGNIYYYKKDFETAIKWHKECLKLAKTRIEVLNTLRRLYWEYRKMGDFKESKKYLTILRREDPGYPIYKRFETELDQLISGEKTEEDFKKERDKAREETKENLDKLDTHQHEHKHGDSSGHDHNLTELKDHQHEGEPTPEEHNHDTHEHDGENHDEHSESK